ncbi:MAG: hypothetical protein DWQ45_08860 [Planctomycetota bacterium]|nr:MAG: hypothetical protein DWQ41_07775 [Planctomycetota bacterium]REK36719.1 MAG: hypothetical protein DWQ45_08860 [Planctomycetota bacterium]
MPWKAPGDNRPILHRTGKLHSAAGNRSMTPHAVESDVLPRLPRVFTADEPGWVTVPTSAFE